MLRLHILGITIYILQARTVAAESVFYSITPPLSERAGIELKFSRNGHNQWQRVQGELQMEATQSLVSISMNAICYNKFKS